MSNKYAGQKCFVIMPFGKKTDLDGKPIDFDYVYENLIKAAVEEVGLECTRCDEIIDTGSIHFKMFHGIFDADVAVVDITSLNANVFYELGIRHALNKFVTLVIRKAGSPIPFNINGLTSVEYKIDSKDSIKESKETIGSFIKNGLKKQNVDSLVHLALDNVLKVERKHRRLDKKSTYMYPLASAKDKAIGIITGDLKKIDEIDVWVNSENTNMQMARHLELSISATIRYLGSKRDKAGRVVEDLISNELREAVGIGEGPAGVVIPTTSGELKKSHNVKRIFHAAAVTGQVGQGYRPIPEIADCIHNALRLMDSEEMAHENLHSILFPLMGTGITRLEAERIVDKLIGTAISYIEENPETKVQKVYFLAYHEGDLDLCKHYFDNEPRVIHQQIMAAPPNMETKKPVRKPSPKPKKTTGKK